MAKHVVDEIVIEYGCGEWWKKSTRETYISVYDELIAGGFAEDSAMGILERLYGATANEFGG